LKNHTVICSVPSHTDCQGFLEREHYYLIISLRERSSSASLSQICRNITTLCKYSQNRKRPVGIAQCAHPSLWKQRGAIRHWFCIL